MSDFVDDAAGLPDGKQDDPKHPPTGAPHEIPATDWNTVCAALKSCRTAILELRAGGGGGGSGALTEDVDDATMLVPSSGVHTKLKLVGSDADSRDNPSGFVVFENSALPNNPKFGIGNPYIAGVGLEAMGVWYTDDTLGGVWRLFLSWERSGTFAAVLDGVRRSAIEVFLNNGDHKPFSRIETSSQSLQLGPGGFLCAPGAAVRSGGVLTLTTTTFHKMGVGQKLFKQPAAGYAGNVSTFGTNGQGWGPSGADMVVASVVNANVLTVTDARANAVNTEPLSFSAECDADVGFGRDDYGVAAVRAKGSTVCRFNQYGVAVPSGLSVLGEGSSLQLGAGGIGVLELTADMVHVQNGKDFYNEGLYRSSGWYNGGAQTQTSQEVFLVGTGSGPVSTTLRAISGKDWMVFKVLNKGQGGANSLTVHPGTLGDTINGASSLVLPANAGATFISQGTDWHVFYHPAPP